MRARPTLTNPKTITSLSQGTYTAWWKGDGGGDNVANYQYKHWEFNGDGRDVWLELGNVDGGITLRNFRNAVIIGSSFKNTTKGNRTQTVGSNMVNVLNINSCSGTCHIEGCIINSNYNRADCIRWSNCANATVVVQACICKYGYQVKDKPGHGDLIQAQGGPVNLYVEKFVGYCAGQGFQLPAQSQWAATGLLRFECKECILTYKTSDFCFTGKCFNIGIPEGGTFGDKPPKRGSLFEDFYICTKYPASPGQNTPYKNAYQKTTFNDNSKIVRASNGNVSFNFAAPYTVVGVLKDGNIDTYNPVPEGRVGVNYDRTYFEDGYVPPVEDDDEVHSLKATLTTQGVINTNAAVYEGVVIDEEGIPLPPDEAIPPPPDVPDQDFVYSLSAELGANAVITPQLIVFNRDPLNCMGTFRTQVGLAGLMAVSHTTASTYADAELEAGAYLFASLGVETNQDPNDDDDDVPPNPPGEDPGTPGDDDDDIPSEPPDDDPGTPSGPSTDESVPITIYGSASDFFDTVSTRTRRTKNDLKLRFGRYARPSSIDYFRLIDTLYPPAVESVQDDVGYKQGILYVDSSSELTPIYTGNPGYAILECSTTASFEAIVSGVDYAVYATSNAYVYGTLGVEGSGVLSEPITISLEASGAAGRYSSFANNFYTDKYGRVVDTTVNTTAISFVMRPDTTTTFTDFALVDSSAFKTCQRIDFMFGPYKMKNSCATMIRIGSSAAGLSTSGYECFSKVVDGGTVIRRTGMFCIRKPNVPMTLNQSTWLSGSLTKAHTEGGNLYSLDALTFVSGGVQAVHKGYVELTDPLSNITFYTSAATGATCPGTCSLFVAGWRGANVETIEQQHARYRHVFAWNVMNQPVYGVTEDNYKDEITLAKSMGLDGFGCELHGNAYTLNAARNLIKAAEDTTDFWLYPIIHWNDMWSTEDMIQIVHEFYNTPVGWFYKGKLVVATYGGPSDQTWWQNNLIGPLSDRGVEIFFMPYIGNDPSDYDATITDGATLYNSTDVTGGSTDALGFYTAEGSARPTQYGFAPSYWVVPSDVTRDSVFWEHYGFEGMSYSFRELINFEPTDMGFTTLTTWNDFGEGSYWCPRVTAPAYYRNPDMPSWTHRGYARLAKYYIQWYRERVEPTVSKEFACVCYRQHPCAVSAPVLDEANEWNRDLVFYKNGVETTAGAINNRIYMATVLNRPAVAKIITVDGTTSANVGAGVYHTYASAAGGVPQIQVERNGSMFLQLNGAVTITTSAPATTRNYHMYADYTEGLI